MTQMQKQEVFARNVREASRQGISRFTAYLLYRAEVESEAERKIKLSLIIDNNIKKYGKEKLDYYTA